MWPWCPICYAVVVGAPAVANADPLAVHLAKLHNLKQDSAGALVPAGPKAGPYLELRVGQAATVAILLSGSIDVPIRWEPGPMPTADYKSAVALAPGLIGRATWAVTAQTADGITVKVSSTGIALGPSSLMAVAGAIVNPTS